MPSSFDRWSRSHGYTRDELLAAAVCLFPAVTVFGVFNIFPILYAAYLSLLNWDGLGQASFAGLANYLELIRRPDFWNSLAVTAYYAAGVTIFGLMAGLLIALGLNRGVHGLALYRSAYFTPVITATVAAGIVWTYLFDPVNGPVNIGLRALGLKGPNWLAQPEWAMPAVIVVGVWKRLGFNMVIYLAGLQSIPREYHEAAAVDGAGLWAKFRHVTWPLLAPTTVLLAIMSLIDSFQVFDQVYVMTFGGPLGSTEVLGLYLYREAFRLFHLGYAAAVGWVIFFVVFLVTLLQWRVLGSGGFGGYGR